MTLQKKQVYLNKVLSKHYKTLRYTLFNKTQNILAFKTTAIRAAQSIGISILTIDTISHNDFPGIIDVTVLNGLSKTKKAAILYEGKTTVPTKFTRSMSKFTQKPKEAKNLRFLRVSTNNRQLLTNPHSLEACRLGVINSMLGAGVCMHKYTLYFNSRLSLQHLNFLKGKQEIKLKNLDRLGASLILSGRSSGDEQSLRLPKSSARIRGEANTESAEARDQGPKKEVRLSKMELSSVIAQVLHKIHFFKNQESLGESFFDIKRLSNILGALVEINSKIYFISDKELKQCGLAGGLKHSATNSSHGSTPYSKFKLKSLIYSKMTSDRESLLKTKYIEPNILFFNFLNIATRTYVIHNIKRIFSKLVNILSRLI